MKLYKLKITGDMKNFKIEYTFSTNLIEYKPFEFPGNEEERYEKFLEELKINGGPQPINVKVKMITQTTDRAFSKNEVLGLKNVEDFMKRIGR